MRLGIFGDSFTNDRKNIDWSWTNQFAEKLGTTAENFGYPATSLFYSYQQFLLHKDKFDLIVFVVTEPQRYTRPVTINGVEDFYCNIGDVENALKKSDIDDLDKRELEHLFGWYFMQDRDFMITSQDLLLSHMESMHDNIIFYPAFCDSFTVARTGKYGLPYNYSFFDMVCLQTKLLGATTEQISSHKELSTLSNHLAKEFNDCFANILYNKYRNNSWDLIEIENITLSKPREYYYE